MAHQIDESKPKYLSQARFMSGRRIIKTSVTEITDENVVDVLRKALATHELNRSEIDYLWKYYRGDQPIRNRVKDVRPEICNKITENRANEIVSFKVGYLCGEPIQYVSRNGGEEIVKQINTLNEYMFAEDKAAQDQELVEWQMICGTAFRLVLPDEPGEEDEAPFELYTLDPRDTFVVYSNEIGNKPLMAVKYSKDDNEIFHYSIYTENRYYLVDGDILVESKPHALDMIPIIEYPGNNARLGSFEIVLPLLDAINNVESNRMDGMEQLVQAFIKFINCDITKEEYEEFLQLGAIKVKSVDGQAADVGVVTTELNQTQSQTLKDDYYNAMLTICGMPNRTDTGKVDVPSDGKTLYRVQTGAFSKRSNADAWAAKLKVAGFDTYIVQMDNLYKVQVGAYSQKSNAENMMAKLKAAGYDAFITTKSGTAAGTAKKSAAEIAKEIYNGTCSDARWSSWGNGADRVNRLKQAGYDPSEVQSEVNKLF